MTTTAQTSRLRLHPLADVVPEMRPDEWRAFLTDVQERGVLEPVHVGADGVTVLDGRHRLKAARELGLATVPVALVRLDGISDVEYIIRAALMRRHLSDDQRAILAARMAAEIAPRRQSEAGRMAVTARWHPWHPYDGATVAPSYKAPRTRDAMAQAFSVSTHKVRTAQSVAVAAPDLASKVLAAALPLAKAATEMGRRAKRAELETQPDLPPDDRLEVWTGDFRELANQIPDDSVDLILTDPPYKREHLPLWRDLAQTAARVLKPSGFLVAYSGQLHLPEVMASLGAHLTYYWLAGLHHAGVQAQRYERHVQNAMKPLLVYAKPPVAMPPGWFIDLVESPAADKDFHDWGQSVAPARYLVQRFTHPGEVVLDPLAGGGTNAVAAVLEGRRAIAIEIDAEHARTIRKRCQQAQTAAEAGEAA